MILYLIPSRKGSKGVPDKNLLRLTEGDTDTITERAFRVGCQCAGVNHGQAFVSSDIEFQGEYIFRGAEIRRPTELCTDEASMVDVVRWHASKFACEIIVLLQPTSPFRRAEDIAAAIQKVKDGATTCLSAVKTTHGHPAYQLDANGKWAFAPLDPFANRQDLPTYYTRCGAFYVARADHIRGGGDWYTPDQAFVEVPWYSGISIDTPEDVIIAKAVAQELGL